MKSRSSRQETEFDRSRFRVSENIIKPYTPYWSSLGRLGESAILKSSYVWFFVVPIMARFLMYVGPEVQFDLWGETRTFTLSLPFTWTVFFYSAVAFSVAGFVYSVFCPEIIREHRYFSDLGVKGRGEQYIIRVLRNLARRRMDFRPLPRGHVFLESIKTFLVRYTDYYAHSDYIRSNFPSLAGVSEKDEYPLDFETRSKLFEELKDVSDDELLKFLDVVRIRDGQLSEAFTFVYGVADESYTNWRAVSAVFYASGILLISWVFFENLRFVWQLTW